MRNNNTGGRSVARGNGRRGSAATTGGSKRTSFSQERPARKSRYSAGEGSVKNSAREGSAKRSYRKSDSFEKPARRTSGRNFSEKPQFAGKRNLSGYNKKSETKAVAAAPKTADDGIRLNKFISNSGICSRREADSYIAAGVVSINEVTVTELGTKVYPNDVVKFNGERIKGEEKVYIVMNKPKDFVTTVSDPYAEKTVIGLVQGKCKARVYPVGRLDKATTGVLLLTNDGELADRLAHPSFEKKKIYHVFLDKNLKGSDMSELVKGINLEDGPISVDEISYIDDDKSQVGVEIHSGRNRIVRRMFEHFGYKVKKLDRVYFAGLTKKNLRRGQWRFLTEQEVAMLKMGSFE